MVTPDEARQLVQEHKAGHSGPSHVQLIEAQIRKSATGGFNYTHVHFMTKEVHDELLSRGFRITGGLTESWEISW